MNFRQKRLAVLRSELKDVGVKWSQAKQLDKRDTRLLFVIGKLLINYPVSFNIEFICDALDISAGASTVRAYRIDCWSTYYRELSRKEEKKRA